MTRLMGERGRTAPPKKTFRLDGESQASIFTRHRPSKARLPGLMTHIASDVSELVDEQLTYHSGLPLLVKDGVPIVPDVHQSHPGLLLAKRSVDLGLGILGLVLILPILLVIALAVRLTSKGPVIFVQKREGLNGELFNLYKFRSLHWEMSDHSGNKTVKRGDKRLTPIGGFIRRTSFDELPQIFNIIKGDMSIVGPRPHVPHMLVGDRRYDEVVPYYSLRFKVRPGLTGWAQAHGLRGPVEAPDLGRARVDHDLAYIANISWHLDLKIILGTIWSEVIRLGRGG